MNNNTRNNSTFTPAHHNLVIAEKPSVGVAIANILGAKKRSDGYIEGSGYIVTWCIGHLVGLAEAARYDEKYKSWKREHLPIIPRTWKYSIYPNKKKQFDTIKKLMNRKDVTRIICATDAGREGELIFRYVYEMAGCKKPFSRLWISSMEEAAIRQGFAELKDGKEYDSLYQSALCRAKADWIIGINATRLFSSLYGKTLNVGRVQTPTLAMLVQRQQKISKFEKERYYLVRADFDGIGALSEQIADFQKAETIKSACIGRQAVCISLITERKTAAPPKLFDLTSLQRENNRLFGLTAKQTLDIAQKLYESKLITYPRTDSKHITSDMASNAAALSEKIMKLLCADIGIPMNAAQTANNAKIQDHHAILPTDGFLSADMDKLSETERKTLLLIAYRFIMAQCGKHIYDAATAVFECNAHVFTARGRKTISQGWKTIDNAMKKALQITTGNDTDGLDAFPNLQEGQVFEDTDVSVTEHYTQPPKPFTEDTLLSAMEKAGADETDKDAEKAGLGTPATRAAIIEKLVTCGFASRKGKQLIPTKDGENLIKILPDRLKSPKLTSDWENALMLIAKGEASSVSFMHDVEDMARSLVDGNAEPVTEHINYTAKIGAQRK